jgi:ABC-2 type transport system ATP-binding protein
MIQVEDVTKWYGEQRAVDCLRFQVADGEVLGFIGPNGAGKTTTIRILCGVVKPDAGEVRVAGYDPGEQGDEVRSRIGVLTETAALYPNLSGIENLRFFAELYGVDDPDRPDELIDESGLGEHKNRKAGTYSTGMKKRLGLAKALLHKPSILLLDEPTSGLDPAGIAMVLEEVERLSKEKGVTVVLCSHVLHQLETVCRRYVIIDKGQALAIRSSISVALPCEKLPFPPTSSLVEPVSKLNRVVFPDAGSPTTAARMLLRLLHIQSWVMCL